VGVLSNTSVHESPAPIPTVTSTTISCSNCTSISNTAAVVYDAIAMIEELQTELRLVTQSMALIDNRMRHVSELILRELSGMAH
jgi:hypothetical protein